MIAGPGMPRKVLFKAQQLGVHNDCIVSDRPCQACSLSVSQAFYFFYSHCENDHEMLNAIVSDFRKDLLEDEAS